MQSVHPRVFSQTHNNKHNEVDNKYNEVVGESPKITKKILSDF